MVKKIYAGLMIAACLLALAILCAPCFLIFSTGNNGELTIWNFIGLAWLFGIFMLFKYESSRS